MGRVLLSALPEEQLEVTLSRAVLIRYTPPCAIWPGYARRLIGCACSYALADRQIEGACARWRCRCCRVMARWWPR